jgi:hypothetical protein
MKLVRNCVRSECPSWEYPNRVGVDESEAERRSSCSYQQTSNHEEEPIKLYRHPPGRALPREKILETTETAVLARAKESESQKLP